MKTNQILTLAALGIMGYAAVQYFSTPKPPKTPPGYQPPPINTSGLTTQQQISAWVGLASELAQFGFSIYDIVQQIKATDPGAQGVPETEIIDLIQGDAGSFTGTKCCPPASFCVSEPFIIY